MADTLEKLAKSLTANSVELVPFLPYLLQDLTNLGASPYDIEKLINKHIKFKEAIKVLDLACGKGLVTIHLAKQFKGYFKGIDYIKSFIDDANLLAAKAGVSSVCKFQTEDINISVNNERSYDIVIYAAAGDVLGTPKEIIEKLKQTIKPFGYIIIDDAYAKSDCLNEFYTKAAWLQLFKTLNVELIADLLVDEDELIEINMQQQNHIQKRAHELIKIHHDKKELFQSYIASQQEEIDLLEQEIKGVTMLIQKLD